MNKLLKNIKSALSLFIRDTMTVVVGLREGGGVEGMGRDKISVLEEELVQLTVKNGWSRR